MVAHDGEQWLPRLLTSLAASTRRPDLVVGVDTGSLDGSARLLADSELVDLVVGQPRGAGFGTAVAAGLAAARAAQPTTATAWVWLLHDDCAPAPDALQRLLEATVDSAVGVVGGRLRAWPSGRRLLEVGVTITGTGSREPGVEPGEYDQGQHDATRSVLAVSTAGMLVRRDVWTDLGGLDPALPLFRDDVDFGWRAVAAGHRVVVAGGAAIFHAEAASRGVRATTSTTGSPHRADRRAALFTLLVNCRAMALPFVYLRLVAGSLLRALGYLIGKLPGAAWDEVCAAVAVLGRPWRLPAPRARRRSTRQPGADVRRLLPPWWTPYANGLDAVLARFAQPARERATTLASSARRLRSRRIDPTGLTTQTQRSGTALARHPLLLVVGVLTLASVLGARGLYGSGFLQGGALLPAPDGAGDWWRLYVESAHPVGRGSTLSTAPYVAMLGLGATVLLGKAWLLVDVLMLFAAPLAGIGAWAASATVVRGARARIWMAIGYGLVPVVLGAVASGHLGTVVASIALPWVLRSGCRLVAGSPVDGWRAAAALGLALSVAVAFAPQSELIVGAVALVGVVGLVLRGRPLRAGQLAAGAALPLLLLMPWSGRVASSPDLLLTEAGSTVVPGTAADSWQLVLGRVGAPGEAPGWVSAGLTLVALLSLLRRDTRARVAAAWLLVLAGLGAAAVLAAQTVTTETGQSAHPWLGVPLVVCFAGAIAAAGIAADGLGAFIGSGSFGWRQPVGATAVAIGAATVVAGLGWWVWSAPYASLHRDEAVPVPAYMIEAMATDDERVLVLRTRADVVAFTVLAGDGQRLGDDSVLSPADSALPALIAGLVSQSRPEQVQRLGELGVGYVVVPAPQSPGVVAQLDAAAGLTRTSSARAALSGWQVDPDLLRPATLPAGPDRGWLLVLQAALWLGVAVLAAPGIARRPLPAVGEQS